MIQANLSLLASVNYHFQSTEVVTTTLSQGTCDNNHLA